MNIVPLSQRDPKWAKKKLGFSNLSIGGYGCTLTCLTMLLNYIDSASYTPDWVNKRLKEVRAFSGPLIWWDRIEKAFPSIKHIKRVRNGYNNWEVARYVYLKKIPVLVEVSGFSIEALRHWNLFIGWHKMLDPWVGRMENTNKYPLKGYSLYDRR